MVIASWMPRAVRTRACQRGGGRGRGRALPGANEVSRQFGEVCSLQTHSTSFRCHVRCSFEVCGVASVNREFLQGTKSAASASVTSMRNRLTPEHISDASSGRCSRSPSMFGCSRMEDVSLDEVRSCRQDMLTISSDSHKTKDRTQLVIVRQTVLCLVLSRCASTTRTPGGVNGIGHLIFKCVCVCVDPAPQ